MPWSLDEVTPIDGGAHMPSAEEVADALRRGDVPAEDVFDRFLPYELRAVSQVHWTPLRVAARVARWIEELGITTVVDIGAGPGKLCVAAALASPCTFTGIEQRPRFVKAARTLARRFGVAHRVHFIEGALGACEVPIADALYLFNPFGENLFESDCHLDDDVELGHARYQRDIALTEVLFASAPVGTFVIEYTEFGGRMPSCYQLIAVDRVLRDALHVWKRTAPSPGEVA